MAVQSCARRRPCTERFPQEPIDIVMPAEPRKHVAIVLIEDDVTLGKAFARVLRAAGYEVWLTATADEGLEKIKIVRPSGVIVDFRMPLVNGLGFLYRLRADERDHRSAPPAGASSATQTPVVVVTGDTSLDDDVKEQLRELGADLRFKPIMPKELLETVEAMVGAPPVPDETPQRTVW
jgi:DNA-binding response OmpR family regulator